MIQDILLFVFLAPIALALWVWVVMLIMFILACGISSMFPSKPISDILKELDPNK